jgi:STE24 endopeptidase
VRPGAEEYFDAEQIERASRYHEPLYLVFLANAAVGLGVLSALAFAGPSLDGWPWWAAAIALATLAVSAPILARLPLGLWAGHVRERRWGFATQDARGWLVDRAKGLAVALLLTVPLLLGLVAVARWFPSGWPIPAAIGAALAVLLAGFLAPVVLEPLFNRFAPLEEEEVSGEVRRLAARAGVPVRAVLVADASRRTRKVNAYVSGLGRTRRVVLYDTLLEKASPRETRLVVAHELGHRLAGHVLKGTLLAMGGAVAAVLVVWAVVGQPVAADIPLVLLIVSTLELVALPPDAALLRRWERQADRFSLELTGDLEAYEATHRDLALANLADLDPPRIAYLALHSHPTPPERIALGRRWASSALS